MFWPSRGLLRGGEPHTRYDNFNTSYITKKATCLANCCLAKDLIPILIRGE